MSHLTLVPPPAPAECRCDRESGRYWLAGTWNCKATDSPLRWSAHKGWHHYAGHANINVQLTELSAAA